MRSIESRIDPRSTEFGVNREAYQELSGVLRERQQYALAGAGQAGGTNQAVMPSANDNGVVSCQMLN